MVSSGPLGRGKERCSGASGLGWAGRSGCSDVSGNRAEFVSVCLVSSALWQLQRWRPHPARNNGEELPSWLGWACLLPSTAAHLWQLATDTSLPVLRPMLILMPVRASTLAKKLPDAQGGSLAPGKGWLPNLPMPQGLAGRHCLWLSSVPSRA